MNPLSLLGLGTSLVGGLFGLGASSAQDQAQRELALNSRLQEQARHQAMVLASRRQQTEIIRNSQRARALALNSAVNQGAQFGTGIQGGIGQIQGQTNWMLEGQSQGLAAGEHMFSLNQQATQFKMDASQAQSNMNTAQGVMSLGGSLIQNAPTISRFFGGIF